ncbi:protein crumbs homolog 3b [Hippoglossus stenolepis]|uniref:protein crumbs homolog 3b n=1 Tax=Hippoglossus stenolepis TaxID=195615 RepID=UPI00159C03BF|nr:protein crumbs homolog 3b [Hippoglossus stenolepis]
MIKFRKTDPSDILNCVRFPPQLSITMATQVLMPPAVSAFISAALSLISLTLLLLLCVIRKKRRMEGTYRPSAEERKQTGVAGSEKPGLPLPLPLPKEERLI